LSRRDFSAVHAALQDAVDRQLLPGVSSAVLQHGEVVDEFCTGWADLERGVRLRADHIFRAFSNTKLVTSCAALLLVDEGRIALDQPVKDLLPALARLRVMKPGAASIDDTEPQRSDITIRHLLSHQAGFSHGVFDPGTPIFSAYLASGARGSDSTLAQLTDILAGLPLLYQPGEGWEYSLASDVLARTVEVASGQRFDDFLRGRILGPLGMVDTGFVLQPAQRERFTALYVGDPLDRSKPGLRRLDSTPYPNAYLQPVARQSGAGGLFSTQADMLVLIRALLPGRAGLLKPETLAETMRNQLPAGRTVSIPSIGAYPGLGFGLAGAVTIAPSAIGGDEALGELQWGGLAGTHWWIHPRSGVAGVLMTHRFMGFWNPFWFEFKRGVYQALA
jgi:CubicO group peptidase (beta-lactamase class C family)